MKESEERWEGKREIENRIDLCFAEIEESRVKSKDKSKEKSKDKIGDVGRVIQWNKSWKFDDKLSREVFYWRFVE